MNRNQMNHISDNRKRYASVNAERLPVWKDGGLRLPGRGVHVHAVQSEASPFAWITQAVCGYNNTAVEKDIL